MMEELQLKVFAVGGPRTTLWVLESILEKRIAYTTEMENLRKQEAPLVDDLRTLPVACVSQGDRARRLDSAVPLMKEVALQVFPMELSLLLGR